MCCERVKNSIVIEIARDNVTYENKDVLQLYVLLLLAVLMLTAVLLFFFFGRNLFHLAT